MRGCTHTTAEQVHRMSCKCQQRNMTACGAGWLGSSPARLKPSWCLFCSKESLASSGYGPHSTMWRPIAYDSSTAAHATTAHLSCPACQRLPCAMGR
jgi:hypothetical protein